MYSIKRQGSRWYVFKGWYVVYYADNKQDCLDWVAEQKALDPS